MELLREADQTVPAFLVGMAHVRRARDAEQETLQTLSGGEALNVDNDDESADNG